jgi:hypothetical protein
MRALRDPAVEVLAHRLRIACLARDGVRLRERDQVQVAVGLPQVLAVAHQPRVAIVELLAECERRVDAGLRVAVPARRVAQLDILQREDVVPAGEDACRRRHVCGGRDVRVAVDPRPRARGEVRAGHDAAHQAPALGAHRRGLHHAVADLRRRHATQAVQLPGEAAYAYCRCQISRFRRDHRSFS